MSQRFLKYGLHSLDDWIRALSRRRTPAGDIAAEVERRVYQAGDRLPFKEPEESWKYVGADVEQTDSEVIITGPCILWTERRIILYCTPEVNRKITLANQSNQRTLLAIATG